MAGGTVKYRHLSRKSSHRQALLRNLVTALVQHETIHTTWPKAKETQRLAEKLITLAKRNNETSRRKATGILYTPQFLLPKLFGELRQRYAGRPGGYTRVLRTEPRSRYDQAPSAVLQLVDGPRDLRFAMAAAAAARDRRLGREPTDLTRLNRRKALAFRGDGARAAFDDMVDRLAAFRLDRKGGADSPVRPSAGDGGSSGGGGSGGDGDGGAPAVARAGAGAGARARRSGRSSRFAAAPPVKGKGESPSVST